MEVTQKGFVERCAELVSDALSDKTAAPATDFNVHQGRARSVVPKFVIDVWLGHAIQIATKVLYLSPRGEQIPCSSIG
jgi:hypothetical protein